MNRGNRPLEQHLEWLLLNKLGETDGGRLWAKYQTTRNDIAKHILPHIGRIEPNLTDHSYDHVINVIDNTAFLLGFKNEYCANDLEQEKHGFSPQEMLCLLLGLLLHDIGNLLGREEHNEKVVNVWRTLASWSQWTPQERNNISRLCRAHSSGKTQQFDTIKPLTIAECYFENQKINMSAIAALIRFADELAEGPHRTSQALIDLGLIDSKSELYHHYALCTQIAIDRPRGRVALTYVIDLSNNSYPSKKNELKKFIKALLSVIYNRALKLNRERTLARYYSPYLGDMRETSVSLAFQKNGCDIGLPLQPLIFNELENSGTDAKLFERLDSRYGIASLLKEILP